METGLSDFHKMVTTAMKTIFSKMEPKVIKYRNYKYFCNDTFRESLQNIVSQNLKGNCDDHYSNFAIVKTFLIRLLHEKRGMLGEIIRHL